MSTTLPKFSFLAPVTDQGGNSSDPYQRWLMKFQNQLAEGIIVIGSTGLDVIGSPVVSGGTLRLTNTGVTSIEFTEPTEGLSISSSGLVGAVQATFGLTNDLAAVERLSTFGFAVRTDVDTWLTRYILGTAGRIAVTDAPGTLGNPVIDIASTYAGQVSITTLGTITSGTWNGTTIDLAHGGSGQVTANAALNAFLPTQTAQTNKFLQTNGTNTSWAAVTTGTVTSVDVLGSSGIVSTGGPITSSGNISLSLGAITPTSVAASGAVTGSNLSGTNTGNQTITLTGGVTGSGTGSFATTVITNANLTGDVTSIGNASTLATVNSNVGSFGSSTSIPSVTVNAKGLVTAASGNVVIAPAGTLSGATLASGVTASSLTSVGSLTSLTVGTGSGSTGIINLFNGYSASETGKVLFKSNNNFNASLGIASIYAADLGTVNESKGALLFGTGNGAAPVERMRIDNTGLVGIGGTPVSRLGVITTNPGIYSANAAWNSGYVAIGPNAGSGTGASIGFSYDTTNDIGNIFSLAPNIAWKPLNINASVFYFNGSSIERMRIDASGNVGIGGTSGGAKTEILVPNFAGNAFNARYNSSNAPIGFGVANSNGFAYLANNVKQTVSTDGQTYDISSFATQFRMDSGQFVFNYAVSGTAGNAITWVTGLTLSTAGQLKIGTTGAGFSIKEGSNCKQGKSTLVAGAVTVSTTAVTSSSRIFISINDAGSGALTNIGSIYVNNIVAGTSFDIRSTNVLDTSSIVWLITEPS